MARIYQDVHTEDCQLAETASVGDRSLLYRCRLEDEVRIQRDNHLQDSHVGAYSYTGQATRIFAARIGRFCSISWNVSIGPSEHKLSSLTTHPLNHDASWGIFADDALPVTKFSGQTEVGHDVWIGCGSFVKQGLRLGEGSVIGANSVVLADTEAYGIYAGTPARLIRHRFPPQIIAQLQALRLFDLPLEQLLTVLSELRGRDLTPPRLTEIAARLGR